MGCRLDGLELVELEQERMELDRLEPRRMDELGHMGEQW